VPTALTKRLVSISTIGAVVASDRVVAKIKMKMGTEKEKEKRKRKEEGPVDWSLFSFPFEDEEGVFFFLIAKIEAERMSARLL